LVMTRVWISRDATSESLGAGRVADALRDAAAGRDLGIIRTGSRGLFWLEPMIEVEVGDERIAYGPLQPAEVADAVRAGLLEGASLPMRIGRIEDHPWFRA